MEDIDIVRGCWYKADEVKPPIDSDGRAWCLVAEDVHKEVPTKGVGWTIGAGIALYCFVGGCGDEDFWEESDDDCCPKDYDAFDYWMLIPDHPQAANAPLRGLDKMDGDEDIDF